MVYKPKSSKRSATPRGDRPVFGFRCDPEAKDLFRLAAAAEGMEAGPWAEVTLTAAANARLKQLHGELDSAA